MELDKNSFEKTLEAGLGMGGDPSRDHVASAVAEVWQRLKPEIENTSASLSLQFPGRRRWRLPVAVFAALSLISLASVSLFRSSFRVESHHEIEVAEGILSGTNGNREAASKVGDTLDHQQVVRTSDTSAVLVLADGTRVELRPQTVLSIEHAQDGERILLDRGSVIVSAAKQHAGHLYVQTPDMTVAVVGTVFWVNAEEAGSRVAVIQGEVQVQQGRTLKKLLRGQQATTNDLMESHPLPEEISWSPHVAAHLALLQQPPAVTTSKRLEFEAASIRPIEPRSDRIPHRVRCRGVDGELYPAPSGPLAPPPAPQGRCVGDNVPLRSLVAAAYNVPERLISGLPNYPSDRPIEPYQIEAKAEDPATATREDLRQMLRNLLVDKLKLVAHRETKELPGYVLSISPGGVKFNETSGDEELPLIQLGAGFREQPQAGRQFATMVMKGKFRMSAFADALSLNTPGDAPVVDRTNLTGLYDVNLALNWVMAPVQRNPSGIFVMGEREFDPPLGKALEQQLGLRLESRKVPVEYLVVDHVEKPAGN